MAHWMRFEKDGRAGFGRVEGDRIAVHEGDLFGSPRATGESVPVDAVRVLTPTVPSKMIALWNNYQALAAKLGQAIPAEPLWLLKAPNSYLAHGATIRKPASYDGKVVYEGELGVVIGKRLSGASEDEAREGIFGYTCINDVTAAEIITRDASFAQWCRAKSFDTFGVFGPVVTTGLDPSTLTVKLVLNGAERQSYPVSDMIFPPVRLVSLLSHELTLEPGDVICCGTSVGVGSMKPGSDVAVTIVGIGTLSNRYE
jgi:2-keto-4-pentenoate hydratase/2-oxohepta-3-ene-1,7-dioic acid hydratase in catechol pathway